MVVRSSDEKSLPPRCRAIPVGRIPAIILAPRRDRMELARIIIRKGDGMRDVERKIARGKRGGRKILHLANLYRIGRPHILTLADRSGIFNLGRASPPPAHDPPQSIQSGTRSAAMIVPAAMRSATTTSRSPSTSTSGTGLRPF